MGGTSRFREQELGKRSGVAGTGEIMAETCGSKPTVMPGDRIPGLNIPVSFFRTEHSLRIIYFIWKL